MGADRVPGRHPGRGEPGELLLPPDRKLLTAKVDLLYNGGIGTYVKASSEEHVEVGDRSNDRVRVDAGDVRARVVGEGGNLGFTQRARLEYWSAGGRINTDAAVNYVVNRGGVTLLPRLTGGAEFSIGDAVAAWVEVDGEAEAAALRETLLGTGRPAREEQEALLEIEAALEVATRERLAGRGEASAREALGAIRSRLGL
jgi:glutamate dehydrogenase